MQFVLKLILILIVQKLVQNFSLIVLLSKAILNLNRFQFLANFNIIDHNFIENKNLKNNK